jgi:hypothetical protein
MLKKREQGNGENGQLYASALLTPVKLLARFMEDSKIVSQQLWRHCDEAVKLQEALMKPLVMDPI